MTNRGEASATNFNDEPNKFVGRALQLLYIQKIKDPSDRLKINDLIRAVGLGAVLSK